MSLNHTPDIELIQQLPTELREDPDVKSAVAHLVSTLTSRASSTGFGNRMSVIIGHESPIAHASVTPAHRGSSPGDWYAHEDQMTHGGSGKGGNWNDDDRVL